LIAHKCMYLAAKARSINPWSVHITFPGLGFVRELEISIKTNKKDRTSEQNELLLLVRCTRELKK
jgi:hypothetical protein